MSTENKSLQDETFGPIEEVVAAVENRPVQTLAKETATAMRTFNTGATRQSDETKLDYEGFYSPLVVKRYAEYLHKHRKQADGNIRDSDNWQKGIPLSVYMKSGFRHFMDWWMLHRGYTASECLEDALCGVLFNAQGYLYEVLKKRIV